MRFSLCLQLGAALLLFALWRPWRPARATCVLASDFGFNLSCAFKKSGLFRVRNLGGVKGYVGLGFTVGDELGFAQSLSITDANKRRSVAGRSASTGSSVKSAAMVPPFKPIAPARNSSRPSRLAAAAPAPATATVPPFQALPASISKVTAFRNALDAATKHFQVRTDVASENSVVAANGSGDSGAARQTVMNAPKEYYPLGYDKNFDDNFASRVQLPQTAFRCGDQKHFPGLYADEDLGCMVFHVCAFTDEGLIMKSFLCPESTLFDQSILKCNWWFYVDCKASARLYDSNIPVSKSYQLMKALAFFSAYNKS